MSISTVASALTSIDYFPGGNEEIILKEKLKI